MMRLVKEALYFLKDSLEQRKDLLAGCKAVNRNKGGELSYTQLVSALWLKVKAVAVKWVRRAK
jgi:hypothetical protein